jgi:hypothetical protein
VRSLALSGRIPEFWIVPMGQLKLVLRFLRKSSAAPVHAGLVETTETPSEPEMVHQRSCARNRKLALAIMVMLTLSAK